MLSAKTQIGFNNNQQGGFNGDMNNKGKQEVVNNEFNFYGTPPLDERETARQIKEAQKELALGF